MSDLSKKFVIKLALDWAVSALRKLAEMLEEMNEDEVASKVDDIRAQLIATVKDNVKS